MRKRKHRPEDGEVILPDALVGTLKSILQWASEQRNDAAALLQHLEAYPKHVSANLEGRRMLNYYLDSSS